MTTTFVIRIFTTSITFATHLHPHNIMSADYKFEGELRRDRQWLCFVRGLPFSPFAPGWGAFDKNSVKGELRKFEYQPKKWDEEDVDS